jgi:hypothetical protein
MGCSRGATDTSLSRRLHQWVLVPKTPFGGGRRILAWGEYFGLSCSIRGCPDPPLTRATPVSAYVF